MEWKDTTSNKRYRIGRTPDKFSAQFGPIRITVMRGNGSYKGKWVAYVHPLLVDPSELKATTLEQAQAEAVQLARDWLRAAEAGLGEKKA